MAIVAGDIQRRLSGGAGNSDPDASLGGIISSTAVVDATLHNLFDLVSGADSAAGDTEYRCLYFRNNHGTLTLKSAKVWISTETGSGDTNVDIGLDPAGVGDGSASGVATIIGDEDSVPAGVTFSHPTTEGGAISVGDIPPGDAIAVWLKWVVNSGAAAVASDAVIVTIKGDTAA